MLRATSPEALERRVAAVEQTGLGRGWKDPEVGIGAYYEFEDPDGHEFGLYYDTTLYVADDEDRPELKNQASRFPGRGVNARRLDHINYLAADVNAAGDFWDNVMKSRETEQVELDAGGYAARWFRFAQKSYDVVYSEDWTGERGRFHHLAFATDTREDILKAADFFLEEGVYIESGPYKHATNQTFCLYLSEPGGNRIEFANAGARLILNPDQPVVNWSETERAKGQAWGMKTVPTFHTHGTPYVENQEQRSEERRVGKESRRREHQGLREEKK